MKKLTFLVFVVSLLFTACHKNHSERIEAQGVVDGTVVTIKSQVTGTIDLAVQAGQEVKTGTLLARIDSRKLETQLEALQLEKSELLLNRRTLQTSIKLIERQLAYFKRQEARFARLVENDSLPREKKESIELERLRSETQLFDQQQKLAQLDLTEQKLAVRETQLKLQLADHQLLSAHDGWILESYVESGETVFPGSAVVDLLVRSDLNIDIFLEERELADIAIGNKAEVLVDGKTSALSAVVRTVSRNAEFSSKYIISEKERQSLLYKVTLGLAPDPALKIGQPVTVRLQAAQ